LKLSEEVACPLFRESNYNRGQLLALVQAVWVDRDAPEY